MHIIGIINQSLNLLRNVAKAILLRIISILRAEKVDIITKYIKSYTGLFFRAIWIMVIILISVFIGKEMLNETKLINPISINQYLNDSGYTSKAITENILININRILERAEFNDDTLISGEKLYRIHIESIAEFEIPQLKLSAKSVAIIIKRALGIRQTIINGDAFLTGNDVRILLYINGPKNDDIKILEVEGTVNSIDSIYVSAAESILEFIDPYALNAYFINSDKEKALRLVKKRLKTEKKENAVSLYNQWATILWMNGDYQDSKEKCEIALNMSIDDFDSTYSYVCLANALDALGRKKESKALYEKAIKLDAKLAVAYLNLGLWYFESSDTTNAIKMFKKCVRIDPKLRMAYTEWAKCFIYWKKYDKAADIFLKASENVVLTPDDYYNWASALVGAGKKREALYKYIYSRDIDSTGVVSGKAQERINMLAYLLNE